ncbi:MAG: hypothetical protein MI864_09880 [Pseudomonadales bacterium]|nr:hypothetical protein [Pseudomonadales bacterium]
MVSDETLPNGKTTEFLTDPTMTDESSAYYQDTISFKPDTSFGLQIDADLTEGLRATAQLVTRGGNDFQTGLEWLYASYNFTPNLIGRIGRQRLPFYNYSDYQEVAYAYHWIRPPIEVYGEGVFSFEGISTYYTNSLGYWDLELQFYYGDGEEEGSDVGRVNVENFVGWAGTATYDWFKVRVSTHHGDVWVEGTPLNNRDHEEEEGFFASLGFFVDKGRWMLGTEVTYLRFGDYIQSVYDGATFDERLSWMITGGVRFGKVMPHITLSNRDITVAPEGFGPLGPVYANQKVSSQSLNLGVRWDFHPKAALKMDYTHRVDNSDDVFVKGPAGLPQFAAGKALEVDVLAFGLDFIF